MADVFINLDSAHSPHYGKEIPKFAFFRAILVQTTPNDQFLTHLLWLLRRACQVLFAESEENLQKQFLDEAQLGGSRNW
jgi:hypothetical protein